MLCVIEIIICVCMCSFGDIEVRKDMELFPYKIVNRDGKPYMEAKIEDE